jgi:excinuclease UvrABC ATPase subunit
MTGETKKQALEEISRGRVEASDGVFAIVLLLLGLLDRLVDSGMSVIVIEHHQAVMVHADWIIDLGPGAGHDAGRIVIEGTPADLVAARSTLTGEHLAAFVGSRPKAVQ